MEIVKIRGQNNGKDIVLSVPLSLRDKLENAEYATVEHTENGILYKPIFKSVMP